MFFECGRTRSGAAELRRCGKKGIAVNTKGAQEIELRANPYAVFEQDDSAISLHARQRWMNGTGQAKSRARQLVREIAASQQPDGGWEARTSVTIRNMFALWLLADAPQETINRGIEWLTQLGQPPMEHLHYRGMFFRTPNENVTPLHNMDDTPFSGWNPDLWPQLTPWLLGRRRCLNRCRCRFLLRYRRYAAIATTTETGNTLDVAVVIVVDVVVEVALPPRIDNDIDNDYEGLLSVSSSSSEL